ncbi:hypothetical protein [Armatimonas sp.]|uniref:hypothetical protein n=1 Tax=Armatimonas sp. TaxID=1872638 RepID=UPI00286C0739|nr:hypothetical protein [Armatimonas sp.]
MASGYTPGLTVSARTTIVKVRRLPLKGEVLVKADDWVLPDSAVARANLPGIMQTVKVASRLGVDASEVPDLLTIKLGDRVERGDLIARTKGLFNKFFIADAKASTSGIIEIISPISGNVGIRESPTPVEITAYIPGRITQVLEGEGVQITAHGALIQGIFGLGGERRAPLQMVSQSPDQPLTENDINPSLAGKVIVGGSNISGAALKKAADMGVVGIVVGGIIDKDMVDYLGYDIGVAITGHENIPLTLVLTEGFGTIAMATRTFNLLKSLEGRTAAISGATQIRAGVIRPEVIVADETPEQSANHQDEVALDFTLHPGAPIRIIREPYFGALATVTELPTQLVQVDSGTEVRVLRATLNSSGEEVTVPRANVEIVAG